MIKIIKGKKIEEVINLKINNKFKKVIVDLGCGDGKKIYNLAKVNKENFYIGIDSNALGLQTISFKSQRKPSKGGLENIIFIESFAEDIPIILKSIADEIQVNFPWGSLLQGVVNVEEKIISNIINLAKNKAEFLVYLTYHSKFEDSFIKEKALPLLEKKEIREEIINKYKKFNIEITEFKTLNQVEKDKLDSSWAKKILDKRNREIYKISGTIKH